MSTRAKWIGVAAAWVVLVGGCGSSEQRSAPTTSVPVSVSESGRALLAVAARSGIGGAEIPGGGFVVFGLTAADGRIDRSVVVFGPGGVARNAFKMSERISGTTSVVIGRRLWLIGTRCTDTPRLDDVGELHCTPGGEVGRTIDLDTGSVDEFALPAGRDDDAVIVRSWSLLRLGNRPLLAADRQGSATAPLDPERQPADPGRVAWLGGTDGWQAIDDPTPAMCQVGEHVVELISDVPPVPAPGSGGSSNENTPVVPRARVLDADGHWGPERSGPTLDTSPAIGLTSACSRDLLVSVTGRSDAEGNGPGVGSGEVVSFDPVSQRWGSPVPLQYRSMVGAFMAFSGSEAVVFTPMGGGQWQRLDPFTGETTPLESPGLDSGAYLLTIHGDVGLAFDPKAPGDRLRGVDVV